VHSSPADSEIDDADQGNPAVVSDAQILSPVAEQGSDKEGHESEKEEGAKPAKKFSNPPRLGLTDSELKAIAERMHEEKNRKRSLKKEEGSWLKSS
jgi:hypothetical protein